LGNLLKSQGGFREAAESLELAVRLAPQQAAIWLNFGVACLELGRIRQAEDCFRQALAREPHRPEACNILGHALLLQGRCGEAIEQLEQALALKPGYAPAHDNLGRVLKAQGRAAEALRHHRIALEAQPRSSTHSNFLYTLNLIAGLDPAEVAAEHRRWAGLYAEPATTPSALHDFTPARPLRIGYVSPDFVRHAVAYFFEPALARHDPGQFEVFCYSDAPVPDAVTERLRRQADGWCASALMSDAQLEAQIRRDRIDILVDLAGHTARNRLAVFARRPAPVQVTWLGYPNTTGLEAIDYRLTEAVSDPPGQTEAWHSEKLYRLPEVFSCYRAPAECPAVSPLPALAAGHVTFGCFNNFAKVADSTLEHWARLLRAVPHSRLLLKSRGLSDPATVARVHAHFAAAGVGADRIECNGVELSVPAHLALYHRVDIALDTFPYNGTTTTCEALWMGVPVVTLAGRTHASRVGASLLTHLGWLEGIAADKTEYGARAQRLAADLPGLARLRQGLRERMRRSPVCDEPRFVHHLEDAFRQMWIERCQRG
jgi:predicted O-linked N-acetylglucosamine transferase (SPINDLY family)